MMTPEERARQILEHNACEELDFLVDPIATAIRQAQQETACGYREALEQIASWEKYEEMERPNTDQVAANGDRCIDIARAALERCAGGNQ